jgi:hypothetical protein
MDKLAIIFAFAIIAEALVNIFFNENSPASKWKLPLALAISIAMTILWGVGVIAALDFPIPNIFARYFDYVLTGVLISRGSNYLHTLITAVKATYTPKIP